MSKSTLNELIRLPKSNSTVSISIRVGRGQSGTITFQQSGKPKIQREGSLDYSVEESDSLKNKSFDFNILCVDMNPSSNTLEVAIDLHIGGQQKGQWNLTRDVEEGGSYQFFGTVEFIK